ncbi:hypothetical protein H4J51_13980 [Colwellia sp. MB02u-18]|nr:hypothetical protein [Colwellia sp. MB3u-45]MBA6268687.1 hypothetical protein [Colwellia sp. MB3u-43]MBA6321118.1 hypothetical protein [Colwellia sp. MB02u-19]MBA6325671.1 hypothetical protein [Colwellia sp. MB02u-18]MBA6332146.1 hypothetical protein [Colwellia sp. MB02u-12]MBA6345755.1 hypothetical protein [Colwellia sp. MB02u-1]
MLNGALCVIQIWTLNQMKDDQFKVWESTRTKGKLNFVLFTGVLSWGLPMFIFMAFMNKPFADGFTSKSAIIHYIVWPLAGVLFGVLTWFMSERKYKKELASRSNT